MCGIVAYVGPRQAAPIILEGLRRLEYRGYDSAGLAVIQDGQIAVRRDVGKLANLERLLGQQPVSGHIGIGHTRWATHGAPSPRNAHPHVSMNGQVVVVHNGIVENFLPLRQELEAEGVRFASETDTEVIVQLIERYMAAGADLAEATRRAMQHLKGAHAIVAMSTQAPGVLVGVRIGNAGGLTLGLGEGEMFLASDIPAILEHTRRMVFLDSREMAVVTQEGYRCYTLEGTPVTKPVHTIPWDPVLAQKGEYRHFMQKEIFEQARSITDTIRGRADFERGRIHLESLEISPKEAQRLRRAFIVACGTSYHAALVGRFLLEAIARLPAEADIGSEFRYRDPMIEPNSAVLAITQSGETVDTLAAMEEARRKGARLWSIVNVIGSQAQRLADGYILMHAGPEVGVASTKAFTASLVDEYLLACYLAQQRGLGDGRLRQLVDDLARLPDQVGRVLDRAAEYEALANEFYRASNFLYLGRGLNYPIALEGALKLKEISYIHAEGYPAGEMKHGPIALIDEHMPVLAIAVRDHVYDKMVSQMEQAKARGGRVIALATEGDDAIREKADHVIYVPETSPLLTPVLTAIPMQLLAYYIAIRRGCDVDQPRKLAKGVTVE